MPFHTGGWPLHPADIFEAAHGFHVYYMPFHVVLRFYWSKLFHTGRAVQRS